MTMSTVADDELRAIGLIAGYRDGETVLEAVRRVVEERNRALEQIAAVAALAVRAPGDVPGCEGCVLLAHALGLGGKET